MRNYWREANTHSIDGLPSLDGADQRKAEKEVKGMDVEWMAGDWERWGIVAEDVEKAGGPGRVGKGRAVGGGIGGVAVQRKVAGLSSSIMETLKSEESRVVLGFVLGFVACGIMQGVMREGLKLRG
jgi:hypothetical protein